MSDKETQPAKPAVATLPPSPATRAPTAQPAPTPSQAPTQAPAPAAKPVEEKKPSLPTAQPKAATSALKAAPTPLLSEPLSSPTPTELKAPMLVQLGMVPPLATKVVSFFSEEAGADNPGLIAKMGAAVEDCTVDEDGTSAGTQLNLLLAQLRLAGVIAPE